MSAIHIKTIKGREYAYDVTSCWDKELKKRYKKTVYLGRVVDKEAGVFEKLRKVDDTFQKALILNFGDSFLIHSHFKKSLFYEVYSRVLPKQTDTLMCLLYYKLLRSSAMQHAETWYRGNYASILHQSADVSSQRVSDFLKALGAERVWREFFKEYLERLIGSKTGIIVDSTGLPNEIDFPLSTWGHHGGDSEQQTRLLMVVEKETGMPLYFRYMAGNIVDVKTLANTVAELAQMGVNTAFALIDAGYYSEENIRNLFESKIAFLTRLPASRVLYKELIQKHSEDLETAENAIVYGKRMLFVKRVPIQLFEKPAFAYVICDVRRKADESTKYIITAKEDKLSMDEINKKLMFKGKLVIVSSASVPADEILPLYYTRQTAENLFGISKSFLDILPLRVHSVETFRGYLLLNFMALVVYLGIKKDLADKYTVEGALAEMGNLMCKVFEGELLVSEPTKKMKDICELLGVGVPNFLGV
jgi:transposase